LLCNSYRIFPDACKYLWPIEQVFELAKAETGFANLPIH
jgi:hypothetical protein